MADNERSGDDEDWNNSNWTSDASQREEDEYHDALASAAALVGENVLDSPTRTSRVFQLNSALHAPDLNESCPQNHVPTRVIPPPLTPENANALSVGIMAQGFAWVRKQREGRKRMYLRNQAERQLQILKEAQRAEESQKAATGSNSVFSNILYPFSQKSDSDRKSTCDEEEEEDENRQKPSISGDGVSVELSLQAEREDLDAEFIPPVRVEPEDDLESNPYILSSAQMQQIAVHVLPRSIAYCRWKRQYSLARDGDDFDVCLRYIKDDSKTLLIVRTTKGDVFGGYADATWEPHGHGGTNFFGGSTACLFKVVDRNIQPYKWTGANRYVQLCDTSHKRIAFGGGGEDGAFGLCLQEDFQVGSTGHCATFDNEPLCEDGNFYIVDLEVFGFLVGQF
jgi:hypothetical protein